SGREWCDAEVLQTTRRRSLARLRKEVEPVEPPVLARLVTTWQGLVRRRVGLDALLDVVENLQGAPLPASILESEILAARIDGYAPGDLDGLAGAGRGVRRAVRPRRAGRRGRGRLARRGAGRRSRRTRRALPHGSHRAAVATRADRGALGTRTGNPRAPRAPRRVVLRAAARGRGRRVSGGDGRCALGSRVEGAHHQRHLPRAARLHTRADAAAAPEGSPCAPGRVPQPPRRPAVGGGAVVAARRSHFDA